MTLLTHTAVVCCQAQEYLDQPSEFSEENSICYIDKVLHDQKINFKF